MTGNDEEHPGAARILAGIESLHARLDALEAAGRSELGAAASLATRSVPAWQRKTDGEARWQVALVTAAAIALQLPVPGRLDLVRPAWILPAAQGALLVVLVMANPHRINRESTALRSLSLTLAALISLANAWAAAELVIELVRGKGAGWRIANERGGARDLASNAIEQPTFDAGLWRWNPGHLVGRNHHAPGEIGVDQFVRHLTSP